MGMRLSSLRLYCINLERRADRWAHVEAQTAGLPCDLERIAAVDGKAPGFAEANASLPRSGPVGPMLDSTLACSLSHFKTWQTFVDDASAGEVALVLEDDMAFTPRAQAALTAALDADLGGYDLLKVEGLMPRAKGRLLGPGQAIGGPFHIHRAFQLLGGAAGYLIRRRLAEHLLTSFTPALSVPIDHFLFYPGRRSGFAGVPYGVLRPAIVRQAKALGSDIPIPEVGNRLRPRARGWYELGQARLVLQAMVFHRARAYRIPYDEGDDAGDNAGAGA